MLHEGAGAHVLSAYVEVVLDNSDGRLPVDKSEVVLRRSIGLKKDEYFIDRKHVSKTEVAQLLETSGLSKANPYNIVPQGKVNALTTMKEEGRLELIKEVAGVKVYDQRRAESEQLMVETADKEAKIADAIGDIDARMNELESEKEEFLKLQTFEKKRKALEYTYYDKELRRAKAELDRMDTDRSETSKASAVASRQEEEILRNSKEAERKLKATKAELARAQETWSSAAREQKELLAQVAQLEMAVKQSGVDERKRAEQSRSATEELEELAEQVEALEGRLAEGAEEIATKRKLADELQAEVEQAEASLQHLHGKQTRTEQFESKEDRDAHLSKEAGQLRASLKKKEAQAGALLKELKDAQARMSESEQRRAQGRQRLAERRTEAEAARGRCAELRAERDSATDERKTLWRKEQELIGARKSAADELDKAHRTLQHSMSRQQWEAVSAVRRIASEKKIKGVHGMLVELFTVDDKFATAVEAIAGNQLFQVVVDSDDVAQTLVKELQKANAGRVTFMPLNRLRPGAEPAYPESEDAIPMISRLSFLPKFRPAMLEVFRKGLIVRTLEVGTRFARSHTLDCVTIGGDQVSRKGAMTGGYLEPRRSRVGAQADVVRLTAELADLDKQAAEAARALVAVDQRVTILIGELQKHELIAQRAIASAEMEAIEMGKVDSAAGGSGGGGGGAGAAGASSSRAGGGGANNAHRAADAQKERAHAALLAAARADHERLEKIESEMASPFSSELSPSERNELKSLHERLRELKKRRDVAATDAARVEAAAGTVRNELDEHLRRRQRELEETLARLSDESGRGADGLLSSGIAARLAESRAKLGSAEAALAEAAEEREAKRALERSLEATAEELRTQLNAERQRQADEAKSIDRLLSRRGVLQLKVDEFTDAIRKLGFTPQGALDGLHASLSSKQLLSEIDKVQAQLAELGHVNKKALDQYSNFAEERERLTAKQQEMDEAREKIEVRSGSSARVLSRTARLRPPPLLTHMILTLPSPPSPPT